jgi:hypothetical protein
MIKIEVFETVHREDRRIREHEELKSRIETDNKQAAAAFLRALAETLDPSPKRPAMRGGVTTDAPRHESEAG